MVAAAKRTRRGILAARQHLRPHDRYAQQMLVPASTPCGCVRHQTATLAAELLDRRSRPELRLVAHPERIDETDVRGVSMAEVKIVDLLTRSLKPLSVMADQPNPRRRATDIAIVQREVADILRHQLVGILQVIGKRQLRMPLSICLRRERHVRNHPCQLAKPILDFDIGIIASLDRPRLGEFRAVIDNLRLAVFHRIRRVIPKLVVRPALQGLRQVVNCPGLVREFVEKRLGKHSVKDRLRLALGLGLLANLRHHFIERKPILGDQRFGREVRTEHLLRVFADALAGILRRTKGRRGADATELRIRHPQTLLETPEQASEICRLCAVESVQLVNGQELQHIRGLVVVIPQVLLPRPQEKIVQHLVVRQQDVRWLPQHRLTVGDDMVALRRGIEADLTPALDTTLAHRLAL